MRKRRTKLEMNIAGRPVLYRGSGTITMNPRSGLYKAMEIIRNQYPEKKLDVAVGRGTDGSPGKYAKSFDWAIVEDTK